MWAGYYWNFWSKYLNSLEAEIERARRERDIREPEEAPPPGRDTPPRSQDRP